MSTGHFRLLTGWHPIRPNWSRIAFCVTRGISYYVRTALSIFLYAAFVYSVTVSLDCNLDCGAGR
jgi:hypothetical protein